MAKRVQLPDGDIGEFPDNMPDQEILSFLSEKYPAAPPVQAPTPRDNSVGGYLQRGVSDLAAGFGHVGTTLLAPLDLAADAVRSEPYGSTNRRRRQSINQFATEQGAGDWTSVANQAAPEIMATGAPIAGVEQAAVRTLARPEVVARVASSLPRSMEQFAARNVPRAVGAGADVGVNAAYAGAQAAAQGQDPAEAAKWGGGGAIAGRALAKTLGAMRPTASPAGNVLLEHSVRPTYGQAGGRAAGFVEGALENVPGVGGRIDAAKERAIGQYAMAEVQRAVAPLGGQITSPSVRKAVEQAEQIINDTYNELKKRIYIDPSDMNVLGPSVRQAIQSDPLLTPRQLQQVQRYVDAKLHPLMESGQRIPGSVAKALDAELGDAAHRHATSGNPADLPLGNAFRKLKEALRSTWKDTDGEAVAMMQKADDAWGQLQILQKVSTSKPALGREGVFSPVDYRAAGGSGPLNEAGLDVLDTGQRNTLLNLGKRGGVGTIAGIAAKVAGVEPVTAGAAAAAWAAATAMYSDAGIKMLLRKMPMPPQRRQWVNSLPVDKQREFVGRYMIEAGQAGSQAGREVGVQMGSEQ